MKELNNEEKNRKSLCLFLQHSNAPGIKLTREFPLDRNGRNPGHHLASCMLDICKSPPLSMHGFTRLLLCNMFVVLDSSLLSPCIDLWKRNNTCWNVSKMDNLERKMRTVGRRAHVRTFFL